MGESVMSAIKVIKNLKPWEVMRREELGEKAAYRLDESQFPSLKIHGNKWIEKPESVPYRDTPYEYAIIDTTTPEIEWDKFDWYFFNQYGGLPAAGPEQLDFDLAGLDDGAIMDKTGLRESPFYYWPGGQRPVPSNVEVEIVLRDKTQKTVEAGEYYWVCGISAPSTEIIAFKLTGKTCS